MHFSVCSSQGFNWHEVIIDSCNGLVPKGQQAITWTNDDPVHWYIYGSPDIKELSSARPPQITIVGFYFEALSSLGSLAIVMRYCPKYGHDSYAPMCLISRWQYRFQVLTHSLVWPEHSKRTMDVALRGANSTTIPMIHQAWPDDSLEQSHLAIRVPSSYNHILLVPMFQNINKMKWLFTQLSMITT